VLLLLAVPLFLGHEALFGAVTALMGALGGALFGAAVSFRNGVRAERCTVWTLPVPFSAPF